MWYKRPVIWNFVNRIANVPESLISFKNTIRNLRVDLEAFSFYKEAAVITKKIKRLYLLLIDVHSIIKYFNLIHNTFNFF